MLERIFFFSLKSTMPMLVEGKQHVNIIIILLLFIDIFVYNSLCRYMWLVRSGVQKSSLKPEKQACDIPGGY